LYVIGEVEAPRGPVKIGLNSGGGSRTGRAGLSIGNWRQLEVLHRKPMAFEDLRWTEWKIHKHLSGRWHVRGEWFRVRPVAERECGAGSGADGFDAGWEEFLTRAETGDLPGCTPWRLANGDCHLERMHRLSEEGRHFDAVCSCGYRLDGGPGLTLPSVQRRFAVEHLHLALTDAAVKDLTGRAGGRGRLIRPRGSGLAEPGDR
jgi:hypothetical protein